MVYVWLAEVFEAEAYTNLLHRAVALNVARDTNVPALICYVASSMSSHMSVLYFLLLSFTCCLDYEFECEPFRQAVYLLFFFFSFFFFWHNARGG